MPREQQALWKMIKIYVSRDNHCISILKELHWLPVSERIKFKILLLTFKALYQQSPIYIQDLLTYYQPSRILRSSHLLLLNPTNFHLKSYGSRAFAVSPPELWSSLPVFIRSCDNLSSFKVIPLKKKESLEFSKTWSSS